MSATLPAPRADVRPLAGRQPAKPRKESLKRERHQADYTILVVVVALIAIGILMVYSSSAIKSYLQRDDPFAIVGPYECGVRGRITRTGNLNLKPKFHRRPADAAAKLVKKKIRRFGRSHGSIQMLFSSQRNDLRAGGVTLAASVDENEAVVPEI